MGVKTSETSEASSTSLATVTSTAMNLSPSSTTLWLSLRRKVTAIYNYMHDCMIQITYLSTSVLYTIEHVLPAVEMTKVINVSRSCCEIPILLFAFLFLSSIIIIL